MFARFCQMLLFCAYFWCGALWAQSAPLKVGFVYVGPVGDAGWSYRHEQARLKLNQHFGNQIQTQFYENIPEGCDATAAIRQLAKDGNQLIFATSYGFANATLAVAKEYPNVKFMHATGDKTAANVGTYADRAYEARYLAGLIAGSMSQSHILGFVAAFPIPEVVNNINAYTIGAREINPQIQVKVKWTNAWYAPDKERRAALELIEEGADVLTNHTDSPTVVQVAQQQGKYALGFHADMSAFGKDAHLTAVQHNWNDFYTQTVQQVLDGTWHARDSFKGMASHMVELSPLNRAIPSEVRALVAAKTRKLLSHELPIFKGALYDHHGKLQVPASQALTDAQIRHMKWFVQGVVIE